MQRTDRGAAGATAIGAAAPRPRRFGAARAAALLAALFLAGCGALTGRGASPYAEAAAPDASAGPPRTLDRAAVDLTDALLMRAMPAGEGARRPIVIDAFVDQSTGLETTATRAVVARVSEQVRARHPRFELRPFTVAGLADRPAVLLGSIAGIAGTGSAAPASGPARFYRIRAVLADARTGRVLDAETVLVRTEDVSTAPAPFFRDAPGWLPDPAVAAYLRTVEARPGQAADPTYLEGLTVQGLVADGMLAYEAGRYREALDRYAEAQNLPAGDQMRVHNGLYLAAWSLGRRREAEQAFARVVDFGLRRGRLAVKFLFRPASTEFLPDRAVTAPYGMWLRQIATKAHERSACLLLTGHASPTGLAAANDRLSQGRAERLRTRLVAERATLRERTRARGVGAREPLIGTGKDDVSDALDRRVELAPLACRELPAAAEAGTRRTDRGPTGSADRAPL